jgi:hypothetical protein
MSEPTWKRAVARRAVRAGIVGALGGLVTYLGVLRAPIGQLAREAGREPSVRGLVVIVTAAAILAILVGEALQRVFAEAAEAECSDRDRAA